MERMLWLSSYVVGQRTVTCFIFLICMGMIYLVELIWLMLSFMQSRPMGGV